MSRLMSPEAKQNIGNISIIIGVIKQCIQPREVLKIL